MGRILILAAAGKSGMDRRPHDKDDKTDCQKHIELITSIYHTLSSPHEKNGCVLNLPLIFETCSFFAKTPDCITLRRCYFTTWLSIFYFLK